MITSIYGLIDPRTDQIMYVGKTKNSLRSRLSTHMRLCSLHENKNYNWLRSLKSAGLEPEIFLIEQRSGEEWQEAEVFWIAYFRFIGANLMNISEGGGRGPVGIKRPWLAELSKLNIGKKHSLEHRAKISAANMGRVVTAETKAKRLQTRRLRGNLTPSEEAREKMRKAWSGMTENRIAAIQKASSSRIGITTPAAAKIGIARGVKAAMLSRGLDSGVATEYEFMGRMRTVQDICILTGIKRVTLYARLHRGISIEKATTMEKHARVKRLGFEGVAPVAVAAWEAGR